MLINLDNIKVGDMFKNYTDMCKTLGLKPLTGDSKKPQLNWIKEHLELEQNKRKFTVKDIITKEIQPYPTRGGANNTIEYRDNLEKLILDILAQPKNKGKIFLSKNKFFYALEMVNVNYLDTKQRIPKLSKFLDIDENIIQEWMDTTGGVLERSLESALNSLRNKSLVIWSKEITICRLEEIDSSEILIPIKSTNGYGEEEIKYITQKNTRKIIREATDDEKKLILKIEKETLNILECLDKRQVIQRGLWQDFKSRVNYTLKDKYKILYYYQSYKILSNPEHIQEEFNKRYILDNSSRIEEKMITNYLLLDRLENNLQSRYTNAIKQLEDNDIILYQNEKIAMRVDDEYIDSNIKLNKTLVDRAAKDIRANVRKEKLEE